MAPGRAALSSQAPLFTAVLTFFEQARLIPGSVLTHPQQFDAGCSVIAPVRMSCRTNSPDGTLLMLLVTSHHTSVLVVDNTNAS
jgi:hypothetical protein